MSSLTNFLKLFKWDTKTDGSQKFNIDKALNENWDKIEANASDVNTALATKSDKKFANKSLSEAGWYRIARFNRTNNPQYGTSIVRLWSLWNNSTPQSTTMIITNTNNLFEIEILSSSTPTVITKLRLVQDSIDNVNYIFLEAYYKVAVSNNVFLEITDESSYAQTMTFEKTEEDVGTVKYSINLSKYNLNDAIGTLSSLSTTNKTSLVNALNEVNNKKINIITGTEFATSEYIDDKQVYRKRINIGALPNATSKTVEHGLSNIRFVKMPQGYATNSNGLCLALPFSNPTSTNNVSLSVNSSNILISAGTDRSNYSGYVELYYTK